MLTYWGVAALAALGVSGDADAGQARGNWSPQTSQFSGNFGNEDDLADGEVMGAHFSGRE